MNKERYSVLSIAGSDSCSGAGIQADIKSVAATGGYCATAITAITAQNTQSVQSVEILSDDIVKKQIDAVLSDIKINTFKLGMLPSCGIVDIVCNAIERYNIKNVVLDPVMISTSADMLVSENVANYIIKKLLPLSSLITPNIIESEFITSTKIFSEADFAEVAKKFQALSCKAVLLKAGHIDNSILTDHLCNFEKNTIKKFSYKKIDTLNTHGTGCSLSSAIASFLSQGFILEDSVEKAEEYLHKAIEHATYKIGNGHGPISHFYMIKSNIQ